MRETDSGQIISDRQRDRNDARYGCELAYFVSYRKMNRRDDEKQWIGRWIHDTHTGHQFPMSPFAYNVHRQSIDSYKALLTVAREYKTQGLAYSDARRLLKEEAAGLVIKKRDYYNLVRLCPQDIKDDDDTITALLRALEDRAFKYRLRTEDTIEDGVVIARKLVQIFFYCEQAVPFTQRFTSNAVLIVDGTFRTNKLKFPLLVAVGKTNTNRTMPVAFSYTPSESAESFVFFFDCMRTEFYYNDICEPAVVIADHSSGMISAYDTHKALPQSRLQICSWHAQNAMIRWFSDHQYTREDIDGDESKGVAGLRQLVKDYVYSYTFEDLEANRTLLINSLQPEDRQYIADNWQTKESRFVVAYTKQYTNLGCRASQTVESQNRLIHQVTHGHMSIAASAAGIADWNRDFYNEMMEEEDRSLTEKAVGVDRRAFQLLTGTVSLYAISLIDQQWVKLKRLIGDGEDIESRPCRCVMRKQWLLPCYHDLWKAYDTGIPLPRSLVHPRYWLAGHIHRSREWAPSYEQTSQ
ncbi:MULE transposase domain-containing protein [Metarhizium brunneum]